VLSPFARFARLEASGGLVLLAATAVALIWANSGWSGSYFALFQKTKFTVGFGDWALSKPLILWINDLLMAFFFLLVGLEIKRELMVGELKGMGKAALPIAAAVGGMAIPALIYVALNASGGGDLDGWGVPMATDIAFALGVLSLAGRTVPTSLKIFLTAFAIVDDLGAVLVIALFYTEKLSLLALGIALALLVLLWILNRAGVRSLVPYLLVGLPLWFAFLKSGVHATVAGVLLALVIPLKPCIRSEEAIRAAGRLVEERDKARQSRDDSMLGAAWSAMERLSGMAQAPLVRLEHALHPLVTWFILPLFALANAGVAITGSEGGGLFGPVGLGILLGLLLGKPLGVVGLSWMAVKLRLAKLPEGVTWRHLTGAGLLGGVGFTMALFIGGLAFGGSPLLEETKRAILLASLLAGIAGWLVLKVGSREEKLPG
jgi:NhaA family Na+:H+ antiporter